jgi:hypothetical protein
LDMIYLLMVDFEKTTTWGLLLDIKPYIAPGFNFWTDIHPVWLIIFGLTAIIFIGSFVLCFAKKSERAAVVAFVTLVFAVISVPTVAATTISDFRTAAYNSVLSELEDSLDRDGFKIISGTPNLKPNTQSSMLLSYEGKSFDCTMFSPKDVNTSIVFSCGEAKLNLEEIKRIDSK